MSSGRQKLVQEVVMYVHKGGPTQVLFYPDPNLPDVLPDLFAHNLNSIARDNADGVVLLPSPLLHPSVARSLRLNLGGPYNPVDLIFNLLLGRLFSDHPREHLPVRVGVCWVKQAEQLLV